jgi:hypothetical protein
MARTVLTVFFLLGFLVSAAVSARASDGAYTVRDVKVDILSESAVKARNKAFGEAQKTAFMKLATRFLSPEELTSFTAPDERTIAGMVQDFEVVSEQLSTKRYVGIYTFRFKAQAANRYFNRTPRYADAEIPSAPRAGLMILPFFQQGTSSTVLWDASKNPWLQAWQKTPLTGNPALVLPLGDVSDMMDMKDDQALTYNPAGLKRIMSRYEARDAVILIAKFNQSEQNPLTVDIYRTDRNPPALFKTLSFETGSAKTLGDLLMTAVDESKKALTGNWKLETIVIDDGGGAGAAAESETVAPAAGAPKSYSPLSGQVRVSVKFSNLSEWLAIRRSLNAIPALTGVKIVALKTDEAVVDLTYADWPSLTKGLSAKGLSLASTGSGHYQLMRKSASATPFYR